MKNYIATTKPIKIECKSHEDWLAQRTPGIGSSDIATIVGLNPYKTPFQLWREKTGQVTEEQVETFAMRRGHYLEDAVARFFEDASGKTVIQRSAQEDIYVHPDYNWARVSPDRRFWLTNVRNDDQGVLECKTARWDVDGDNLPPYWFTQLQYQLGVMGRENGSLAWYNLTRDAFDYRDVILVPDYFNWIMEEAEKFQTDNILGGIEPALTNAEDVLIKYSKHTPGTFIEASDDLAIKIDQLKSIKTNIKKSEEEQKLIEDEIKVFIGEAESLNYHGGILATFKAAKDSPRFDSKAFQEAHPELYAQFTNVVPGSRRFLVK